MTQKNYEFKFHGLKNKIDELDSSLSKKTSITIIKILNVIISFDDFITCTDDSPKILSPPLPVKLVLLWSNFEKTHF
jgi:hypothetical protein